MTQKSLIAKKLAKSYKKRNVVKDVSISINEGEIVGLLGPNGAGKTTCFYMIVGLVKHDNGSITLNGEDVSMQPVHGRARKGIGYLPQEASIFKKLSVENNILSILQLRKDLNKSEKSEELESLMNEFSITHIRKSLGMALSGGERRRVEIARALAANPSFILLDEPFAGVDPISVIEIKNVIKQLQKKGLGVLITDHNVRETLNICEKAYIVGSGTIIAEGTAEDVLNNKQVQEVYLGKDFNL